MVCCPQFATTMLVVLADEQILRKGLEIDGFDDYRQNRVNGDANDKRFRAAFGSSSLVLAEIWEDLQTTDNDEARIHPKYSSDVDRFLMAMYFLKNYY